MANHRLEKMLAKRETLEAQIRLIKMRDTKRERKEDTRRKILVGAYALERMEKDADFKAEIMRALEKYLTRDVDRVIFGLAPLSETKIAAAKSEEPIQKASARA